MNNWSNNLKFRFQKGNIAEKIIFINIAFFLLTFLFNTFSFLMEANGNFIINWFALSPDFSSLIFKPWSLISYGFIHSGFFHIAFNLIFLYYIGRIFLDFFTEKQFLTYYLFGIIFGGFIFMLSYNYLPALKTQQAYLVGASAGVTAILVGIAARIPQYALRFQFIGNIKLKHIAIVFVVLDVIQIPNGNAGGHLAHLGGALIGFLLTNNYNQGSDITKWFENLFKTKKQKPFKTVYKNKARSKDKNPVAHQKKIDAILDKISKSGYETLSKEEKDFLFKAGKN